MLFRTPIFISCGAYQEQSILTSLLEQQRRWAASGRRWAKGIAKSKTAPIHLPSRICCPLRAAFTLYGFKSIYRLSWRLARSHESLPICRVSLCFHAFVAVPYINLQIAPLRTFMRLNNEVAAQVQPIENRVMQAGRPCPSTACGEVGALVSQRNSCCCYHPTERMEGQVESRCEETHQP